MKIRFQIPKQNSFPVVVIVLIAIMVGLPSRSFSQTSPEQACTGMGAACLCSDPLNTNNWTSPLSGYYLANDGGTKKCKMDGHAVTAGAALVGTSAAEVLNRLPVGHTNTIVARGPVNGNIGGFIGHKLTASDPMARIAHRIYVYYSAAGDLGATLGHAFHDDTNQQYHGANGLPLCGNSGKLTFDWAWPGTGPILQSSSNGHGWASYSFGSFGDSQHPPYSYGGQTNPTITCCLFGPGADPVSALNSDQKRGRWFRFEKVITNRNATSPTGGLHFKLYVKDVTRGVPQINGGNEFVAWDTSIPCTAANCGDPGGPGWTAAMANALAPPNNARLDNISWDAFRSVNPQFGFQGPCTGFQAYAYEMVAGWTTDTGQRIGGALEIEGGSTTSQPNAPTGVTIQ